LCALLATCTDIELVGETGILAQIEDGVRAGHPDVVLLEAEMSPVADSGLVHRILAAGGDVKVLLLGERDDRECLLRGLMTGACGYIPTRATSSDLVAAIRTVRRGDYFPHPLAARALAAEYLRVGRRASPDPFLRLSRRQQVLVRLASQGDSNRQIAEKLSVSPRTVQRNRANVMARLDTRNQTELVRFAIRRNLTTIESPVT
jgi:two-component system response regulator NreC